MDKLWKNASTSGPPVVEVFFVYVIVGISLSMALPFFLSSFLDGRRGRSNGIFDYVIHNYLFFVLIISIPIIIAWLLIVYLKLRPALGKDDKNIYIYHSFFGKAEYPKKTIKSFQVLDSNFFKTELEIITTYNFKHQLTIPLCNINQYFLDLFIKDKKEMPN